MQRGYKPIEKFNATDNHLEIPLRQIDNGPESSTNLPINLKPLCSEYHPGSRIYNCSRKFKICYKSVGAVLTVFKIINFTAFNLLE